MDFGHNSTAAESVVFDLLEKNHTETITVSRSNSDQSNAIRNKKKSEETVGQIAVKEIHFAPLFSFSILVLLCDLMVLWLICAFRFEWLQSGVALRWHQWVARHLLNDLQRHRSTMAEEYLILNIKEWWRKERCQEVNMFEIHWNYRPSIYYPVGRKKWVRIYLPTPIPISKQWLSL